MSEEIIDNVDVSGCEFYEEMRELPDNLNGGYYIQHCYCGLQGDNYCICNKNPECYYKQLKHLQAENERLDNEAQDYHNTIMKLNDLVTELKAENERLKEEIKRLNKPVFLPNIEQEATNKYRKALEEIRAYVQTLKKKKSNFYTLNDVITDIANNIEKIINEVLDERN